MLQENLGNPRLRMAVRLALTGGSIAASLGVANAQTAPPATDAKVFEVHVNIAQPDTTLRPGMTTGNAIAMQI